MQEGEEKRQREYMALFIRSEQQFTCLFKFILVCKATVTAPGEKAPPTHRQRKSFALQEKQGVHELEPKSDDGEIFGLCETARQMDGGKTARVSILGNFTILTQLNSH